MSQYEESREAYLEREAIAAFWEAGERVSSDPTGETASLSYARALAFGHSGVSELLACLAACIYQSCTRAGGYASQASVRLYDAAFAVDPTLETHPLFAQKYAEALLMARDQRSVTVFTTLIESGEYGEGDLARLLVSRVYARLERGGDRMLGENSKQDLFRALELDESVRSQVDAVLRIVK